MNEYYTPKRVKLKSDLIANNYLEDMFKMCNGPDRMLWEIQNEVNKNIDKVIVKMLSLLGIQAYNSDGSIREHAIYELNLKGYVIKVKHLGIEITKITLYETKKLSLVIMNCTLTVKIENEEIQIIKKWN